MSESPHTIFLVSDGTGETGGRFLVAALHQFEAGGQVKVTKFTHLRTEADVEKVVAEASSSRPLVLHTVVREDLRAQLTRRCDELGVPTLDLLGPLLHALSIHLKAPPQGQAGKLHQVDDRYFRRIEAIEFTLQHDDGRLTRNLALADIVILGVSRTSKTPTSVYLAQEGFKVVNIPIVVNQPLPEALFKVPSQRVVGLTIDPHRLAEIRSQRLLRIGAPDDGQMSYADLTTIQRELDYAHKLFGRNKGWQIIDVTNRSIEETAREILDRVYGRSRTMLSA